MAFTQAIIFSLVWLKWLILILTQLAIASVLLLEYTATLYLTTHDTLDIALNEASSRLDSLDGTSVN